MRSRNPIRVVWEWLGHLHLLGWLIGSEFVRTALLPTVISVMAAISGYMQGVPVMWIFVGTSLVFMAVTQALLRGDEYRERKNPLNKLTWAGTHVTAELDVAAGMSLFGLQQLQPNMMVPGVPRNLEKGQIAVELKNNATFPISCFLESAATELQGITPPRSQFPKAPVLIGPGSAVRLADDAIIFHKPMPCGRMAGKMDITIRYGLPGRERHQLRYVATLDIPMENWGFIPMVVTAWSS
jgi:hypothetical protein